MAAYGFAPASLIAPLASVQLLVNIVMAPHTLGERRLPGHIISAVTIPMAIVGITTFGSHPEPEFTLQIMTSLFKRWVRAFPPSAAQGRLYSTALPTQPPWKYHTPGFSAAEVRTSRRSSSRTSWPSRPGR